MDASPWAILTPTIPRLIIAASRHPRDDGKAYIMSIRKVSVLINNFNYARFLRQAIDSVLTQAYRPLEVIVVDDGSTDESRDIIRSYGDKIHAVFKENGGQASAFNAGFARATGDIICFLDSDDYHGPNAVERIVAHWNDDTDILHHRLCVVDETGAQLGYKPPAQDLLDSGDVSPLVLRMGGYIHPPTSGLVYSRRLLENILPMPLAPWRICADSYLHLTAALLARVEIMDETIVFYRVHGSNFYGLPITARKLLNRRRMKIEMRALNMYRYLLKQLAQKHGPALTAARNHSYFTKLLFYRASSPAYKISRGAALYWKMLRDFWVDNKDRQTLSFRLQKTLIGQIIIFAPRWVLRLIYPALFAG